MGHEPQTEKIHIEMLEALKMFDVFCVKNNIKYTLFAGTLLGAVREKGFIPWDDDIDVALSREEYDKLCNIASKITFDDEYYFDRYCNKIPKFWLKRKNKDVTWIDVFVFDNITSNHICMKIKNLFLIALTAFSKDHNTIKYSDQRSENRKKWQVIIFRLIYNFGKIFPQKFKLDLMNIFQKYAFLGDKKYLQVSNDEYETLDTIYNSDIFDKYEYVDFEDTKLMIISQYHHVLSAIYGDNYMTPIRPDGAKVNIHNIIRNE